MKSQIRLPLIALFIYWSSISTLNASCGSRGSLKRSYKKYIEIAKKTNEPKDKFVVFIAKIDGYEKVNFSKKALKRVALGYAIGGEVINISIIDSLLGDTSDIKLYSPKELNEKLKSTYFKKGKRLVIYGLKNRDDNLVYVRHFPTCSDSYMDINDGRVLGYINHEHKVNGWKPDKKAVKDTRESMSLSEFKNLINKLKELKPSEI